MMRLHYGVSAPSQSTLRYLRQIISQTPECSGPVPPRHRLHAQTWRRIHGGQLLWCRETVDSRTNGVPKETALQHAVTRNPLNPSPQSSAESDRSKRTYKQTLPYEPGEGPYRRIRALIATGQLRKAQEYLLRSRENGVPESMVQKMAGALMHAYHKVERFADVIPVFSYVFRDGMENVTIENLNHALDARRRGKAYQKLVGLYRHFQKHVKPNWRTYELYFRGLVETNIEEARVLFRELEERREPLTSKALGTVLAGIARHGQFDSLVEDFEWLCERLKSGKIRLRLYNVILEECLVAGKGQLAKHYMDTMLSQRLKPDRQTFEAFLHMQAMQADWDGMAKTLRDMKTEGFNLSSKKLNVILQEYARSHPARELSQFFYTVLNEIGASPSSTSYNILIKHYFTKGQYLKGIDVITEMRRAGYKPNALTFKLFYNVMASNRLHNPQAMAKLARAIAAINRSLVERPYLLQQKFKPTASGALLSLPPPSPLLLSSDLRKRTLDGMEGAYEKEEYLEAIRVFRDSFVQLHKPSARMLHTLIKIYSALPETVFTSTQPRDLRGNMTIFAHCHQAILSYLSAKVQLDPSNPIVYELVITGYKLHAFHALPQTHGLTVHAATQLCNLRENLMAVQLMNLVSKYPLVQQPWDIKALTVLTRAYAELGDVRGVAWVVERIEEQGIVPDWLVAKYIYLAGRRCKSPEEKNFCKQLMGRNRSLRETLKAQFARSVQQYVHMVKEDHMVKEREDPWEHLDKDSMCVHLDSGDLPDPPEGDVEDVEDVDPWEHIGKDSELVHLEGRRSWEQKVDATAKPPEGENQPTEASPPAEVSPPPNVGVSETSSMPADNGKPTAAGALADTGVPTTAVVPADTSPSTRTNTSEDTGVLSDGDASKGGSGKQ